MILRVLGSSSRGNCYLLQSEKTGEVLILEAGVKIATIKKALSFNVEKVVGCIITHEHGDHAKSAADLANAFIPVYMSEGTAKAKHLEHVSTVHMVQPLKAFSVGSFDIMPFPTEHDAAQPYGYLIKHPECGCVLFATDTYYLRYRFPGVTNIMIECNYSLDKLRDNMAKGLIDHKRYNRTIKSHMSYQTCMETLMANDLTKVNNIVLIHLSADNSNADEFRKGIERVTHKNVVVAEPAMRLTFNKTPY